MNARIRNIIIYSTIVMGLVFGAFFSFAAIMMVNHIKNGLPIIIADANAIIGFFEDFFKEIIDSIPM